MKLSANLQSPLTDDLLLLATYHSSSSNPITLEPLSSNEEPSLHTDTGLVTGYHSILNKLSSPSLLSQQEQQKPWIEFRLSKLADLTVESEPAKELNDHLASKVYLVGNQVTLSDLVLFSGVHSFIEGLSDKQKLVVPNIVRWFDNIQHLPQVLPVNHFDKVPINQNLTPQNAQDKKEKKGGEAPKAQVKKEAKQAPASDPAPAVVVPQQEKPAEPVAPVPAQDVQEPQQPQQQKEQPKRERKEQPKKEKKETKPPANKGKAAAEVEQPDVAHLDIRIGHILEVHKHPEADNLYVEQIDLGEGQPRTIVSGLVNFVPVEEMANRKVVVLCNLKPKKTRGVESNGMVLCSKKTNEEGKEVVEPLDPPTGSQPGDRVFFPGLEGQPDPVLNPKKKYWEKTQPEFRTNDDKVALYKDVPFTTANGVCTTKTVAGGSIS